MSCVDVRRISKPDTAFFKPVTIFTPNQYGQIMKLIDKKSAPQEIVSIMIGIHQNLCFISHMLNRNCITGKGVPPWIVNTRAANHMVSSLDILLSPILVPPNTNNVQLPNGQLTPVTHTRFISLFDKHDIPIALLHFFGHL